jgi:YidC/Oxa1 family membrane protein insertase
MDRRTILAFGLIFLILMTSNYLLSKFYSEDPEEIAADSTFVAMENEIPEEQPFSIASPVINDNDSNNPQTDNDSPPAEINNAEEASAIVGQGMEKTITVTSPLYEMEISTLGGRVVSYKCTGYNSYLGGPVQLIPEDIPQEGNEAVLFRRGEINLKNVIYNTDDGDINMSEGEGVRSLTLTTRTAGGMELSKILTFNPDEYGIQVAFVLTAVDAAAAEKALNLLGSPEEFRFGWNAGLALTERVQKMELPALRTVARLGDDYTYKKRMNLEKDEAKVTESFKGTIHFAGIQNRYFTAAGIVPGSEGENVVEGRILLGGNKELVTQSWAIELPALPSNTGDIAVANMDLYIGPMIEGLLTPYDRGLEKAMDLGWKLFRPISEVVLMGMDWMHKYISNYGIIIIIFSILTKLMFYPLTKSSTESMKKMQEVQPKLKALQEKYKDDKEKLNAATMALYKDEKVNPLAGCLPLLLQSPVFIALYQAFSHTIALRGQPFFGWITDLSQPDAITQLPFALPFLGSDLNVLPILMSVAMYYQSKFTPNTGGGQMAAMTTMMPILMVFIFYNMPSGLVLYWLINTIMQGYQSWKIHKVKPAGGVA